MNDDIDGNVKNDVEDIDRLADDGDAESDAETNDADVDGNTIPAATARDVCEYLVKAVVDEPAGVEVDALDRRGRTTIEVHVAPGDMGRVIGKRGRIAQSIRAVVRAAAVRDGAEVDVEFVD